MALCKRCGKKHGTMKKMNYNFSEETLCLFSMLQYVLAASCTQNYFAAFLLFLTC